MSFSPLCPLQTGVGCIVPLIDYTLMRVQTASKVVFPYGWGYGPINGEACWYHPFPCLQEAGLPQFHRGWVTGLRYCLAHWIPLAEFYWAILSFPEPEYLLHTIGIFVLIMGKRYHN